VRAGLIGEIGCQAPWTALERTVMQGAVIAMQQTGAALNVHPGRHEDQPHEVADFLSTTAVPMDRVILSHIDRTIFDDDRLLRLADTGVVIEFATCLARSRATMPIAISICLTTRSGCG
jgi:phosphotriesterase-related protein